MPVNSRLALAVGFGSLLAIIALAGIDSLRVLQDFRRNDDRIRQRFLFQNHVLNDVRSEVYLSGTYVRDYLLEPEAARAEIYRVSLEEVRKQMESAVESYGRQAAPEEGRHYTALKGELAQYWEILAPIFKWDSAERQRLGYAFLRDEVFPRRQNMLAMADRIAAINEQQLNSGNDQVVGLLGKFQARIAITLFGALALGAGMAAFSVRRILRLETQAQTRYEETAEARGQFKDLSARLVQAQETERKALSRELHDEVGQSLSAVLIELRNLSTGLGNRSEEQSRKQVDEIKGLVESAIRVVRNMALLLRPSMLDDLGLIPALKWQAREVSKRTAMDVSVAAEAELGRSSGRVQDLHLSRGAGGAAQLFESRARDHGPHPRAAGAGRLTLSIQDDGQGFDSKQVKGLGLLGIQERVARLGGECSVHSEPGTGTILTVELPVQESDGSAERGRA